MLEFRRNLEILVFLTRLETSIAARFEPPRPPHSGPSDSDTGPCSCCTGCRRDLIHLLTGFDSFQKHLTGGQLAVGPERIY